MKDNKKKSTLSYEDSGVSVSKGDAFVEAIKPFASKTTRPGHVGGIGGFGGLFDIRHPRLPRADNRCSNGWCRY